MANTPPSYESWTDHEMSMIRHVEVFLHKPAIMKKAEGCLNQLKEGMVIELDTHPRPWPAGMDLVKGQIARGENNKGFPFISLDLPQLFTKNIFFTYRTLFWWGHYLGFSLILKGDFLHEVLGRLETEKRNSAWTTVYMGISPTPWEWEWTEENYVPVASTSAEKIRQHVESTQYLKLIRFYPFQEKTFSQMDWTLAGIDTWRVLSQAAL